MKPFLLSEAVKAIGGRYVGDAAALDRAITSVTSDSRTAGPGALFVAFRGNRVDGHDFMAGCVGKGAVACVTEREPAEGEMPAIVVDSSLRAIGALAAWHRSRFDIPVVGITGSVGKTTTKEMISAVLSQRFATHSTEGNHNNELGVPWTLLRLDEGHEVSVVEMGISDFGEMRRLTAMVRPSIAVFSVIGDAHLEFLGDREGVLRAKGEIFESMDESGLAVLNGDDELLKNCRPNMRRVLYGCGGDCDVRGEAIKNLGEDGIELTIRHRGGSFAAKIPAFGSHTVYAALAAAAVGLELGLTEAQIAAGIADYHTVGDRARVLHVGDLTVVSDCYNANPNSVRAALASLSALKGRRVALLGDMLELGDGSDALHAGVGCYAAELGIDLVVGCGPHSRYTASAAKEGGANALYFADKPALLAALEDILRPGDCVLVKASLGMAFKEVVERIMTLHVSSGN